MKTPQNSDWALEARSRRHSFMFLPVFFALALLTGCAGPAPQTDAVIDTHWLLSGDALLGQRVDTAALPEDDILELPPEMRAYLSQLAPGASGDIRLQALLKGFESRDFSVEYEADATLTAAETYRQQRGNCMAFTVMMVAMARELGAEAHFNQVEVPPVWSQEGAQTFVVYRHINMVSENLRGRRVVDFNLAAYDPVYDQRKLSDTEAFAQYYSNRGLELMQRGDKTQAFLYLRKALALRPGSADLWANLGALYSRYEKFDAAEQSYQQALQLDTRHAISMSNLERLYRREQRTELAEYYAERARYHRERNPYYLYYQARNAYEHGNFKEAKRQLRRALWKYENDHRFHFLMGLTSYQLGDIEDSRSHFVEAFSLADNPGTKQAYTRKLDYLREHR